MNIFTKKNILKNTISLQKPSNNVVSNIWDPNIMVLRKLRNGMERPVRQNLWRMPFGIRGHKRDISLGQMVLLVILWLVEQAWVRPNLELKSVKDAESEVIIIFVLFIEITLQKYVCCIRYAYFCLPWYRLGEIQWFSKILKKSWDSNSQLAETMCYR